MLITLKEWDEKTFSKTHAISTLRSWASSGLIQPKPVKVGNQYMVEEFAQYTPMPTKRNGIVDPIVERILRDAA